MHTISEDKLNICIVCDTKGRDDEGMKKIARQIAKQGNERGLFNATLYSALDAIKSCRDYDVIHFIGGPSYKSVLAIAAIKLLSRKTKTILTFSNPFWGKRATSLLYFFKPDVALALSSKWQKKLLKSNVYTLLFNPSGVETDKFRILQDSSKQELRQKLNLPTDTRLFLHVGHIKRDRNIAALTTLAARENSKVIIIGSTTTKLDTELKNTLINAGCIVICDYIEKIEEYYQACDTYIFPTLNPRAAVQVPLSVLEALSCGCEVISTRFGGLEDFLDEKYYPIHYVNEVNKSSVAGISERTFQPGAYSMANFEWSNITSKISDIYIAASNSGRKLQ